MSAPQEKERNFEQALKELEARVQKLEGGELELDQALKFFEEGVALVRECHERLDAADARIVALAQGPGGIVETPIANPDED